MLETETACPRPSRHRFARRVAPWARALPGGLLLVLAAACGGEPPSAFGEPVDAASAVPLASLLASDAPDRTAAVAVSGRIGEVCRSAGCWFVLQDGEQDALVEIIVDLERVASFTVPASVQGRRAIVRGRLVGESPDLRIDAVGLLLE